MNKKANDIFNGIDLVGGKFMFSYNNLDEVVDLISATKKIIKDFKNQKSPRSIIIETWLLVDFILRDTILTLLDVRDHSSPKCDLRYTLLPKSFRDCLDFLEEFKKAQDSLPQLYLRSGEPHLEYSVRTGLLSFIIEREPNIFFKLNELEAMYYKDNGIEPPIKFPYKSYPERKRFQSISLQAHHLIKKFTDEWFKQARRLNKARNNSAHIFHEDEIYKIFGINGEDKLDKLKIKCKNFISELVGIEEIEKKVRRRLNRKNKLL